MARKGAEGALSLPHLTTLCQPLSGNPGAWPCPFPPHRHPVRKEGRITAGRGKEMPGLRQLVKTPVRAKTHPREDGVEDLRAQRACSGCWTAQHVPVHARSDTCSQSLGKHLYAAVFNSSDCICMSRKVIQFCAMLVCCISNVISES